MFTDLTKHLIGHDSRSKNRKNKSNKKCDKVCNNSESSCTLSTFGTYYDANNFELSKANLPYEKCQNFPKLIKKFVETVGLCNLIKISETIPNGGTGGRATAINNQYSIVENFNYKGFTYNIRLTLTKTDGTVIYDSVSYTSDSSTPLSLHTTRMEIQRATEREWGSMKRTSSTTGETYVYTSIWIPNILLLSDVTDLAINTEVINFRFAYQVDQLGNPLPISNIV